MSRKDAVAIQVRLAIYYFLYFMSVAVFAPYFNLYLASRGLSGSQVGIVLSVMPLVGIVVQPIWGMLNDNFHIQRFTMFLGIVAGPILLWMFPTLHAFAWFVVGGACIALFQRPVAPIVDSMTVQMIGPLRYGRIRLFGSLGYAVIVVISATLFKRLSIGSIPWIYAAVSALTLVGWAFYPMARRPSVKRERTNAFVGVGRLLKNRWFVSMLGFVLLITVSQAINGSYFSLYYQDLHHPLQWLGVIYALGALSELPFFFFAGRLLGKFGPERVFFFGALAYLIRWCVLSLAPPTWVLVLMQLLHGVSFGLTYAAGVAMAATASDETNRATAQSLFNSVNMGLSSIVGSLVGGMLLDGIGPRGLYAVAAAVSFVGLSCMAIWIKVSRVGIRLNFDEKPTASS